MEDIDIIWCKKNLRITDNEIFSRIEENKKVLAVYFFEPEIIWLPDIWDFQQKFILESLRELQHSFIQLWIPLLILPYNAAQGFSELQKYYKINQIHSHEETGNWATYIRDRDVIEFCKTQKIVFSEYTTNGVVRRLKNRDDWHKIWSHRMSEDCFKIKNFSQTVSLPDTLTAISKKTKSEYIEKFKNITIAQKWGELEWKKILQNFLDNSSSIYMYHISKPLKAESSCSRLSPYIATWCLSIKYIYQKSQERILELKNQNTERSKNHKKSINLFLARIHWQSHFIQKLEDEPEMEFRNINKDFDAIRTNTDIDLIEKVFSSQSGIPYIDAVMKQLHTTWWTNFRSRAIIVSFLCNTCMQPWQVIAPRVAKLFTDYEPWIHYPQFQMQSGTTGINTIRIYNPVYNGKQKDPEWYFIKKYLPELSFIPEKFIHEPHLWEDFSTLDYPKPIVDIKENNKIAKDTLWRIKGNIPKSRKEKIVKKHASRVFRAKKSPKKNMSTMLQTSLFQ